MATPFTLFSIPRSTLHHGEFSIFVLVQLPSQNLFCVLPSTARSASPGEYRLLWLAAFRNAMFPAKGMDPFSKSQFQLYCNRITSHANRKKKMTDGLKRTMETKTTKENKQTKRKKQKSSSIETISSILVVPHSSDLCTDYYTVHCG